MDKFYLLQNVPVLTEMNTYFTMSRWRSFRCFQFARTLKWHRALLGFDYIRVVLLYIYGFCLYPSSKKDTFDTFIGCLGKCKITPISKVRTACRKRTNFRRRQKTDYFYIALSNIVATLKDWTRLVFLSRLYLSFTKNHSSCPVNINVM